MEVSEMLTVYSFSVQREMKSTVYKETCMIVQSHDYIHPLHSSPYKVKPSTSCMVEYTTHPLQRHSSHHPFQMWHISRMVSMVGACMMNKNIYKLIIQI